MSDKNKNNFDRLEAVASKRYEWASTPRASKIALLEQIQTILSKDISYDEYKATARLGTAVKGYRVADDADDDDGEAEYETEAEMFFYVVMVKEGVEKLLYCLKVKEGMVQPPPLLTKGSLNTRVAPNGQVVIQTFPSLPFDQSGILGHCTGELWLDPAHVRTEDDVQTFVDDVHRSPDDGNTNGGVMIVLGAGNHGLIAIQDILHGLFAMNCVVYLKQHTLRTYMNDLILRIFKPMMDLGYFDVEPDTTNERCTALLYHPAVTAVHLTGGKATHDTIVWGPPDSEERRRNISKGTPKLKATMTSELGAVSPWIVIPSTKTVPYTKKAMEAQAKMIACWIFNNASCNCNAPKCLVVADDWDQRDEFCSLVEQYLSRHRLPVAYYPGIEQRWNDFATRYEGNGTAKRLESTSGLGIKERHLSAPLLADKPLLLPYLVVSIDVDLDTEQGRAAAKKEYAFRTEPFAPVYTIATLKGTSGKDVHTFTQKAATFCNEYLFGTLSGSITVQPELVNDRSVQQLIADLRYGSLGVNTWGGIIYVAQHAGKWGGYPGERLDDVSSGIGYVGNSIGVPYAAKFVMTSPIDHFAHGALKRDLKTEQKVVQAVAKYTLNRTMLNQIKIVSAVLGVDLTKVAGIGLAMVVALVATIFARGGGDVTGTS